MCRVIVSREFDAAVSASRASDAKASAHEKARSRGLFQP
jgi:hypothetical protein